MADDLDRERLERRWELVAAHRERLLRVARSRTASLADAEDAVQETLLRSVTFENLDEERVGPFLTTVVTRICADRYRANGMSDRLHQRLGARLVDDESPEEQVCDDAEAAAVAAVVTTLPKRQQAVVRARSIGLSCGEVAHHLGLTYSAVESALSRARATVRARVDVCLDATALAGARVAHVLRHLPAELPGAGAAVIGGLLTGALAVTPAAPVIAAAPPAPVHLAAVHTVARPAPRPARPAVTVSAPRPVALPQVPVPGLSDGTPQAHDVIHGFKAVPVHIRDNDPEHKYTFEDRIYHCVEYGVDLTPTIQCSYPPGEEPGNGS
jgi:RNA polymerase sigma-70 factor (ECF subfamily)